MRYTIYTIATILFLGLSMNSCGNKSKAANGENSEVVDKNSKEYASAYICPMHCKGSGSDKAGKCPVCKMDYVANKDHKGHDGHNHDHDGHDHNHDHDHHNHDHNDHDGHNH